MKKIFFLSVILLLSCRCFSQTIANNEYNKFIKSFRFSIFIPVESNRNCTPVNCLLKIQVDQTKNIKDLKLSDSADPLFVTAFNKNKNQLDIKALENFIKTDFGKNECNTYLMPLSIGYFDRPCAPGNIKIDLMYKYFQFDKIDIGNVTFLPGIHTAIGAVKS